MDAISRFPWPIPSVDAERHRFALLTACALHDEYRMRWQEHFGKSTDILGRQFHQFNADVIAHLTRFPHLLALLTPDEPDVRLQVMLEKNSHEFQRACHDHHLTDDDMQLLLDADYFRFLFVKDVVPSGSVGGPVRTLNGALLRKVDALAEKLHATARRGRIRDTLVPYQYKNRDEPCFLTGKKHLSNGFYARLGRTAVFFRCYSQSCRNAKRTFSL